MEGSSIKVKFGLFFDPYSDHDFTLQVAQEAEKQGFDTILLPDHYMSPYTNDKFDSWVILAYLAARVEKIRLGTCVTPIPLRHPSVLAKMVTTVDVASGGRVVLGVGAGWVKDEFVAYGIGWDRHKTRLEKTREGVELILKLWTEGEKISYSGKYYSLKDAVFIPKPVQRPHPPLWWGGTSDWILEMAATYGHGWIPYIISAEDFGKKVKAIKSALKEKRRDVEFTFAYCGPAIISKDPAELARQVPPDKKEKAEKLWLAGDPQTCIKRIEQYVENGANYIAPIILDRKKTMEGLGLFGREVIPAFK